MAVTTIWSRSEINVLLQHYPSIKTIQEKVNKSRYKIDRKAQELGLISQTVKTVKVASPHNSCKIWKPKRRTIKDIESDIEKIEAKISKGLDLGSEWNKTIQDYNALLLEYDRNLL